MTDPQYNAMENHDIDQIENHSQKEELDFLSDSSVSFLSVSFFLKFSFVHDNYYIKML